MTIDEYVLKSDTNHEVNPNILKTLSGGGPVEETFDVKFEVIPSDTESEETYFAPDKSLDEIREAMEEEKMFKVTLNIDDIPGEISALSLGSREFLAYAIRVYVESEAEQITIIGFLDATDKKSEMSEILGGSITGKFALPITAFCNLINSPEGKFEISVDY